jgi:hypothetical protein
MKKFRLQVRDRHGVPHELTVDSAAAVNRYRKQLRAAQDKDQTWAKLVARVRAKRASSTLQARLGGMHRVRPTRRGRNELHQQQRRI